MWEYTKQIYDPLSNITYILKLNTDGNWEIHVMDGHGSFDHANTITSLGRLKKNVRAEVSAKIEQGRAELKEWRSRQSANQRRKV